MQLSVDLSLYPFQEDFVPPVKDFITWLKAQSGLNTETHATSTIITGEQDRVMTVLNDALNYSREQYGRVVFVAKFLPDYEALK